jgi:predicted polyphosphate/ATP-dependent NAD kinase
MVKGTGKRLGLIVNPVAGLGGRVGLKGSDGAEIQRKARELGAVPESLGRAALALERIAPHADQIEVITYPQEMGEDAARQCAIEAIVIGSIEKGQTTAEDTRNAARDILKHKVDLLLFAGGDGTARDVYSVVGEEIPVLGIPAGVKIHSAAFGVSPAGAGDLAALYLQGRVRGLREAEVMDVDEEAFRRGIISARLYGYLRIPFRSSLVQGAKAASSPTEQASLEAIARDIVGGMEEDCLYIIGPGTTTRAIAAELGLDKTLLGVDVVRKGEPVAADVNESQLLELLQGARGKIVVTPIGGQGYIFGRGNQQISPRVIEKVGKNNIIVVSTTGKINALRGNPLLVDTGDPAVDEMLSGYLGVVTGHHEQIIYRVSSFTAL